MSTSQTRRSARRKWLPATAVVIVAVAFFVLLGLYLLETARPPAQAAAGTSGATVERIVENPAAYYGQYVNVPGEIDEVVGPRSFVLEGDELWFEEEILVITAAPLTDLAGTTGSGEPLDGRSVMVVGEVRSFAVADFEARLGTDLNDAVYADWDGRPAIIADSIVPWPAYASLQEVTVDDLTDNPSAFYGQTVTVHGEADDVIGAQAFSIEDSDLLFDDHLLVLTKRPVLDNAGQPLASEALEERHVLVTGMVRPFALADLERDTGIALADDLYAQWQDGPVLVAESVRLLPERMPRDGEFGQ